MSQDLVNLNSMIEKIRVSAEQDGYRKAMLKVLEALRPFLPDDIGRTLKLPPRKAEAGFRGKPAVQKRARKTRLKPHGFNAQLIERAMRKVGAPVSKGEIRRMVGGIPKTSVSHAVDRMVKEGKAEKDVATGNYRLKAEPNPTPRRAS